ncbi:MAG: hypothetical protein ABSG59_02450 [Verrucomicrobiota bacterium]|jgi:hypothetical protein
MPENRPLFEEMLSSYPAEKRELARAAYNRFVDGDTAHFFTQLFLLLDVYANFANRIPQAMKAASDDALATLKDIREEIGMLAQTVETKSVSLGNATEDTRALCLATQQKCEAAAQRLEKLTRDIGQQVDTKAIIDSIRKGVDAGVNKEVIKPFMERTEQLAEDVLPTLERIRNANEEAGRVWPGRIWKMALACGLVLGLAVAIAGTCLAWWKIRQHYNTTLADQIVSAEKTLEQNKAAFQLLAAANVPIKVVHTTDANGEPIAANYALMIEGAQAAEMRQNSGVIFFASVRQQKDIEDLLRDQQQRLDRLEKLAHPGK